MTIQTDNHFSANLDSSVPWDQQGAVHNTLKHYRCIFSILDFISQVSFADLFAYVYL